MSSRVFQARTSHTVENPQLCGLTNKPIFKDDWCLYLVCHGANARPEYQIKVVAEREVEKEYYDRFKRRKVMKKVPERDYALDGRKFRTVYDGKRTNPSTGKKEKVFLWQEYVGLDADGEETWRTVKCWSQLVHADAASALGYEVRADKDGKWLTTVAFEGDRTVGSEHSVSSEEENGMEALARATLTDEEAGLVPPSSDSEDSVDEILGLLDGERKLEEDSMRAVFESEAADDDDREAAEALGMTLVEYRKVMARWA